MADLVKANEATAARRRLYFHLVGADGITPATGEAGGQPQISTNGGAWTNTGVGTLTAIGNGRYYADPTQAAVATAGDEIESRYKSASTAECPGTSLRVVAFDPYDANALGLGYIPGPVALASGVTVSGWTAAGLQELGTTVIGITGADVIYGSVLSVVAQALIAHDTGFTGGDAPDGSVVKEIADLIAAGEAATRVLLALPNATPAGSGGLPILGTNTAGLTIAPAVGDAVRLVGGTYNTDNALAASGLAVYGGYDASKTAQGPGLRAVGGDLYDKQGVINFSTMSAPGIYAEGYGLNSVQGAGASFVNQVSGSAISCYAPSGGNGTIYLNGQGGLVVNATSVSALSLTNSGAAETVKIVGNNANWPGVSITGPGIGLYAETSGGLKPAVYLAGDFTGGSPAMQLLGGLESEGLVITGNGSAADITLTNSRAPSLVAAFDAMAIESGITAGASLVNDASTQLTAINLRQAVALILSALDGVLSGAATNTIAVKPAGKPAGSDRISATVDADGNRSAITLRVPT